MQAKLKLPCVGPPLKGSFATGARMLSRVGDGSGMKNVVLTPTLPLKRVLPACTHKARGFVRVAFVPACGAFVTATWRPW